MTEFPKYPNIDGVLGTSLPIVTSVMAAVSAAILAVPLARAPVSNEAQLHLRSLPWSPTESAIVFSMTGMALFAFSTLSIVYAQSRNLTGLSVERKAEIATQAGVALGDAKWNVFSKACQGGSERYYLLGHVLWVIGLGSLVLAVAALGSTFFPTQLLPGSAGIAVGLGVLATAVPSPGHLVLRLVGLAGLAGAVFVLYNVT